MEQWFLGAAQSIFGFDFDFDHDVHAMDNEVRRYNGGSGDEDADESGPANESELISETVTYNEKKGCMVIVQTFKNPDGTVSTFVTEKALDLVTYNNQFSGKD